MSRNSQDSVQIKKQTLALSLAALALFLVIAVLLHFKSMTHVADENARIRSEMSAVAQRLEIVDQSLNRLDQYSEHVEKASQSHLEHVKDHTKLKAGEAADALEKESEATVPDVQLLHTSSHDLIERTNALVIDSSLVLDRMQGLASLIERRREVLSFIPSLIPADGRISSPFGIRKSPFTGRRVLHKGIDIAASYGSEVLATADGVVIFSGRSRAYGNAVVISHGYGLFTKYAHNSVLLTKVGDTVKRGDVIARVGSTGRSTGAHVHYEVWVNGKPVNPRRFFLEGDRTSQQLVDAAKSAGPILASLHDTRSPDGEDAMGGESNGADRVDLAQANATISGNGLKLISIGSSNTAFAAASTIRLPSLAERRLNRAIIICCLLLTAIIVIGTNHWRQHH